MKNGVVLFIVEGPSDSSALMPYIEKSLTEIKKLKITVKVMHGDVLTEYLENTRSFKTTAATVKGDLKTLILNYLKLGTVKAEQIKARDIVSIYYITDTDYCFQGIEEYHKNKAKCLKKIFVFDTMELIKNKAIPFKTIFFSKHLEHILENDERNLTPEEKEKIAMSFSEQSMEKEGFFVEFFLKEDIKKWATYNESYLNIVNYQGRACNMNNLINEFKLK